jgi:hypothetical protein
MKLSHEEIQGTWIVAGSEIDHVNAGDEVYLFTSPDRFEMEFRVPDGRRQRFKYQYRLTEEGFVYGTKKNLVFPLRLGWNRGFLSFAPITGWRPGRCV